MPHSPGHDMRLLARLAVLVATVLAPTAGAQTPASTLVPVTIFASTGFGVSTRDFFGANGLTGRWGATACTGSFWGQQACAEFLVETGIEAATGIGAVRYGIIGLTQTVFGNPTESRVFGSSTGPNLLYGSASKLSGGKGGAILSGIWGGVRRNSSPLDNPDGVLRFETFVPTQLDMYLFFRFIDRDTVGDECPYFGDGWRCRTAQYDALYVHTTTFRDLTTVPEPSTYALFGTGLLTLGGIAARRRKRAMA